MPVQRTQPVVRRMETGIRIREEMEMSKVTVTVSGGVGSGKSALCGEIEILCKALSLKVEWIDGQQEKNLTHADWTEALEMYKPEVSIVEQIKPASPQPAQPVQALTVEQIARNIWNIRRESEDRCDMELEDMSEDHSVWDEARAVYALLSP